MAVMSVASREHGCFKPTLELEQMEPQHRVAFDTERHIVECPQEVFADVETSALVAFSSTISRKSESEPEGEQVRRCLSKPETQV